MLDEPEITQDDTNPNQPITLDERLRREETNRGAQFEYCLLTLGASHNRAASDQAWKKGEVLSIDSGGNFRGYIGDLCRMGVLGDTDAELDELTAWVAEHLGVSTPLHFSAFHPDGDMRDAEPTPLETLRRARERAQANGLLHVYAGNVRGHPEWTATWCPGCGARLVDREGFGAQRVGVRANGTCVQCGRTCEGVWQ